ALLQIVTSANIACGFHAGDADVMARTMRLAVENGVGIGAHPGFADLQGFGRRRIKLSPAELENTVIYQLGAARAMAAAQGGRVTHLKLHGAMSNMAMADYDMARTAYAAARRVDPDIILMVLAGSAMERAAIDLGGPYAGEIFADRAYEDDATLVDRSKPGAMIHDASLAAPRILEMIEAGAIIAASGKHIPCKIDTICVHGDGPEALDIARTLRAALIEAGHTLTGLAQPPLHP
ncbi:MAG: 5-oxoprolinase subunit PxpA, partial [Pseudomonadota bacterium]